MDNWKEVDKPANIPMGLGELASIDQVFPRKFRWVLIPENQPDLSICFSKLKIDYTQKTITTTIYEFKELKTLSWLQSFETNKNQSIKVDFVDGCGGFLCAIEFELDGISEHTMLLDYSNSEAVDYEVKFKFKSFTPIKAK